VPVKAPPRRQPWLLLIIILCILSLAVLGIGGHLLRDRLLLLSGVFATPTPSPTQTTRPTATSTPPQPTSTPTPTLTPTQTSTATPAWPGEFSVPILAAIAGQPPSFTADFATGAGRIVLWRCYAPECVVEDGVMRVFLENQGLALGGYLRARDFVLQFDLLPVQFSPNAAAGVFFHHELGITDQVNLNIFPTELQWFIEYDGPQLDQTFGSGQSPQIDPAHWLTVLVIARGEEVAVYFNNEPMAYGRDTWTVGDYIYLYANASEGIIRVDFDNVLFWDLAKFSGLP
jgi:hypothetical protein